MVGNKNLEHTSGEQVSKGIGEAVSRLVLVAPVLQPTLRTTDILPSALRSHERFKAEVTIWLCTGGDVWEGKIQDQVRRGGFHGDGTECDKKKNGLLLSCSIKPDTDDSCCLVRYENSQRVVLRSFICVLHLRS